MEENEMVIKYEGESGRRVVDGFLKGLEKYIWNEERKRWRGQMWETQKKSLKTRDTAMKNVKVNEKNVIRVSSVNHKITWSNQLQGLSILSKMLHMTWSNVASRPENKKKTWNEGWGEEYSTHWLFRQKRVQPDSTVVSNESWRFLVLCLPRSGLLFLHRTVIIEIESTL